ncbi:MAG: RNA polymerase sigma factor [Gammaproteobacteria bacterium]|nr:RNA polymerase sigma factor [Gammaproteobacteria bacterium]
MAIAEPHFASRVATEKEQVVNDEQQWVRKAQAADAQAFEALYRLHVGKVYGLCLRMTGNASEAEDCTQEAFIQAWRKLDKFRGDSSFGTWMHKVAVNSVLGRMRKSRREQDRLRLVAENAPQHASVGDGTGMRDLEQAIDELPSGARHVFVLQAVYGYTHEETGNMLGIATGTSKAQLHRARRMLAQQLETGSDET